MVASQCGVEVSGLLPLDMPQLQHDELYSHLVESNVRKLGAALEPLSAERARVAGSHDVGILVPPQQQQEGDVEAAAVDVAAVLASVEGCFVPSGHLFAALTCKTVVQQQAGEDLEQLLQAVSQCRKYYRYY